jgi:colanic acid biosynthesis glycosyl transferase WcaI
MAQLLLLTLVFRPDNVSTAQLMADLAEGLQSLGHTVTVVTSKAHYNPDRAADAAQPRKMVWFGLLTQSSYRGMTVYHAWMPRKGVNKIYRIITWLGFHAVTTLASCVHVPRPQVVVAPSPPLTIGLSAWLIARFHRSRYIYNVQEIYPDVAINLGVVKSRRLINALLHLEQFIYKEAAAVSVISCRMRDRLLEKGVAPEKLALIPNFVDVGQFVPMERDNEFSRRHGFTGKFLISYAGNMGKPQHLETLLYAAAELLADARIHFLLMGSGSEVPELRDLVTQFKLRNVTFLDQQPYEIMPQAYAAADASYVPQAIGTSADGVPSKVYRIMSAARPVIASTDKGSDLDHLITAANCGAVLTTHDPLPLANLIRSAIDDVAAWRQKGANGRKHVLGVYDRQIVIAQYDSLVRGVTR